MDRQCLSPLSRLQALGRRRRRVQWQVHDRADGAARRIARDAAWPCAPELSQFLPARGPMAIHRRPPRGGSGVSGAEARDAATAQAAALRADALAGLSASPKTLPCKWLYDAEGSRLFE